MTDFKAKMHQIRFRLGLRPRPRWGSLQRSPRPPSWIWEPTSKEREREGGEGRRGKGRGGRGGEGRKGNGRGRAMSPHHYLQEVYAYGAPPTSKSWLRHWWMLMRDLFAAANLLVFFKKLEALVQVSMPMHYLFWTLNMSLRTSSVDCFVSTCVSFGEFKHSILYVLYN